MNTLINAVASLAVAPFALTESARKAAAERETEQYFESISADTLPTSFGNALAPLLQDVNDIEVVFAKFATTSHFGRMVWDH